MSTICKLASAPASLLLLLHAGTAELSVTAANKVGIVNCLIGRPDNFIMTTNSSIGLPGQISGCNGFLQCHLLTLPG